MTFKELREASGMTRTQFAEYFCIPYRTIQSWELGDRKCPEYLLKLMEYKLKTSALLDRIEKECVIAQDYNIRIHTDWLLNMIRADLERGGEDAEQ